MIFIQCDNDGYVTSQHFMPFDEKYGLGKTEEELQQEGILVEFIPEPEIVVGKSARLRYDGTNLVYEYTDIEIPIDKVAELEGQVNLLKEQNAQMLLVLVEGGLM